MDIGCGIGVSTVGLKKHFRYVEGHDLGANLIEHAQKSYREIQFKVCPGEQLKSERQFNLVTSATSFYWMNREVVLPLIANVLAKNGIFCAYKYDFPVVSGPIRNIIESDLALHWSKHRDVRLIQFEDTLQQIEKSGRFVDCKRFLMPNIIELTPMQVALFFLSASSVPKYIEASGGAEYADNFVRRVCESEKAEKFMLISTFMLLKERNCDCTSCTS